MGHRELVMEIHGAPQTLSGEELLTIGQEQNGRLVLCSMPISLLSSIILNSSWASSLPTEPPSTPGIIWNNKGSLSIS
ncbi:conserved hypothetical protein [Burkholderia latens]